MTNSTSTQGQKIFVAGQKDNFSPIEHYDTLALVVAVFVGICVYVLSLVSKIVKEKNKA